MRKIFTAAVAMLMVMLLASCSYVFSSLISGSITGEVEGENGPIDGAKVLIYDSATARDEDYSKALLACTMGTYQDMANGSIQSANTTEGEINTIRVAWKTSSSAYGEDYDIHTFYILILKDGYRPAVTDIDVMSGSGSLNQIRIDNLELIYDSSSTISGTVTDSNDHELSGMMVYAYPSDYEDFDALESSAESLCTQKPESYADAFVPGKYHGMATTAVDGRYSIKVMWDSSSSGQYSILVIGNGYKPRSLVITCTDGEPIQVDARDLEKATKAEETV